MESHNALYFCSLQDSKFAVVLGDGSLCVYEGKKRLWKKKSSDIHCIVG